ncbi:MAG: bifunctional oligoribonuclease/PAP phosphatase NrnA [Acidimicrobiia bacterium]|nr:bifunctional oligoribonuclease/PAP phosphatase NrnA [Acidimicrobiia bacterium]
MTNETRGMEAVAEVIARAETVGVVGHVNPDGDALGAMVGLALAARNTGKSAVASFAEPFRIPQELRMLDSDVLVRPKDFPTDLDVAVAVDTSVPDRVGDLAGAMEKAGSLAVIDHHLSDGSWGDAVWIDSSAAATTEMVYDLLVALDWDITPEVASALYVGLVTDTGRFQYSNTTPKTFEIAAELLRKGVKPDQVGQQLFEEVSFAYLDVVSRVLGRAVLDDDHRFVWSSLTQDDLDAAGLEPSDADGLIDLIRLPRAAEVACLLKMKPNGVVKGSLRSRGAIDVAAIARTFGGGGHHNAAGFTATDPADDVIEQIVAQLP